MIAPAAFSTGSSSMESYQSSDAKWYCLRAKPKHEHIAAAHLRQCEDMEVYCPRVKIQRSTRRGLVWFTEALFPNYLFARFEMALWQSRVRYAQGVSGIVRFGLEYPEVPDSALADLRLIMNDAELTTVSYVLTEGDVVEIVEGPFRGQTGVVKQLLPARERVKVLLEVLGGTNAVDLCLTSVFKEASLKL
jgi:transcriptional antiterminator RfaH